MIFLQQTKLLLTSNIAAGIPLHGLVEFLSSIKGIGRHPRKSRFRRPSFRGLSETTMVYMSINGTGDVCQTSEAEWSLVALFSATSCGSSCRSSSEIGQSQSRDVAELDDLTPLAFHWLNFACAMSLTCPKMRVSARTMS